MRRAVTCEDARLDVPFPARAAAERFGQGRRYGSRLALRLDWSAVTSAGSAGKADPALGARLRLLVADADPTFAGALATVLSRDPMVDVVAVATTVRDAAEGVERVRPDIALIGEFPRTNLGHLRAVLARLNRVAVILLLRPDRDEAGAADELKAAAFLRREPSAEETLSGFLEVAAFAVGVQISRADPDQ